MTNNSHVAQPFRDIVNAFAPHVPPPSPLERSHAALVAAIAHAAVPPLPLEPSPGDFAARGLAATTMLSSVKEYLRQLVDDATENDPTTIMRDAELIESIDAHLSDLASDIAGTFAKVAERIVEGRYGSCPRGPMYRHRGV
jgi:hypothetical protein